jgi:hypothetical protein
VSQTNTKQKDILEKHCKFDVDCIISSFGLTEHPGEVSIGMPNCAAHSSLSGGKVDGTVRTRVTDSASHPLVTTHTVLFELTLLQLCHSFKFANKIKK